MTRIIAGSARGRRLAVPAGGARPTSDRVRESLFASLDHFVPAVVYPIAVGGPLVLVLLLGGLVYRERLTWAGWLACVLGATGIVLLSIGQGLAESV